MTDRVATTERSFRPAGWSAPVVIAPCAAALFGASMWWATHAMPTTASSQPTAAKSQTINRSQAMQKYLNTVASQRRTLHRELEHALAARQHEAHVLTRRLHQMTAEISKAQAAAAYQPPPVNYAAPAAGPAPVAPIQMAPAPAPPPVQANTGASGAP